MKKRLVLSFGILFAVLALAGCKSPEVDPADEQPAVINIAAIQGITVPATGGTPVRAITENAQYSGTVTWSPNHTTFAASTVYTATVTLTAKTGYTLQGVAANFFKVAGATATNSAGSGVVKAVFPATAATGVTSVNVIITAPVKGASPDTSASAGNGGNFTPGAISWSPNNNPFLGNTVYTATVTLTANSGYSFNGLSSATVNGQSAVISNNTGSAVTLSRTFPATNAKAVTNIAVKTQPTNLSYTHGDKLDLTGLVVTLTHDDTTTEDVVVADFAAKNITANPAQGTSLVAATHNGKPVTITYGSTSVKANTANLSVALVKPGLNRTAHNRILISVTSTVGSGQSIEYGISATNNAAAAAWQSDLLFTGLNTGTTYYIFARIAENANSYVGPASDSLQATTRASNVLTVTSTAEWEDAFAHIRDFGNGTVETPQTYAIAVSGDVPVAGSTDNSFSSVTNVAVTLQGSGKLYLTSWGYMIRVNDNQTLIIDSANLTLQGLKNGQNGASQDNKSALIICSGGTLELKNGEIRDNISKSSSNVSFGVVYVVNKGTFIMNGGAIINNRGYRGGGVYLKGGNFTLNGGTISGNTSITILTNAAGSDLGYGSGGGVYVDGGNFTMNGGTISGNTASEGGGVYVGGGGYGYFTMTGGTISDNKNRTTLAVPTYGGGVYGSFTMTGGTISGNSASYGGGVFADTYRSFSKTGGIIYGNDASDAVKNTGSGYYNMFNNYGHAVFYKVDINRENYYRDSTLGENDNLFSSSSLPANSGQTLNGWTKQ